MKYVITGSIAYDYLMSFPGKFTEQLVADKLDRISVSFLVDTLNKQRGGCAANIAYSLALLGETPLLQGAVGQDFEPYRRSLEEAGVDTSGTIVFDDVFTASFFANTDLDNNQICSFYTGAMQYANQLSIQDWADRSSLVIISPNDPDAMRLYAKDCQSYGIPYIYDPSQQIARLSEDDLKAGVDGAKILILNEYEYELFLNKTNLNLSELQALVETIIITLGDKGAEITTRDATYHIPTALETVKKDPTGVGDAFRAGLMKGLKYQFSWETIGRMGSLAAIYVLETDGPQSHVYHLDDFVVRYIECFGPNEEIESLK